MSLDHPSGRKILEGVILNMLDDLDAKINGIRAHLKNDINGDSNWTGYHRLMERYFFKGNGNSENSAPIADEAKETEPRACPAPGNRPEGKSRPASTGQKGLRVSLGEQLREKNLDLFMSRDEEKD